MSTETPHIVVIPFGELLNIEVDPIAFHNPKMSSAEFDWLLNDMQAHGQKDPVLMFDNKIVDGRHRLAAAKKLKIDLRTYHLTGTREEAEAAVSSCDVRRNLTTSQIAMKCAYRIVQSRSNADGSMKPKSEWYSIKNLPEIIYKIIGKRSVEAAIKIRLDHPHIAESVFLGHQTMTGAKNLIDSYKAQKEEADKTLKFQLDRKAKYATEYAPEAMYFDLNEEYLRETYSEITAESYRMYMDMEEFHSRQMIVQKLVVAEHQLQECAQCKFLEDLEQTAPLRSDENCNEE
jgi:hypothetical protein